MPQRFEKVESYPELRFRAIPVGGSSAIAQLKMFTYTRVLTKNSPTFLDGREYNMRTVLAIAWGKLELSPRERHITPSCTLHINGPRASKTVEAHKHSYF